jgi:predicted lactoylglutathione lyase
MLASHEKFREFTPKALAAGGTTYDVAEDFGFMYTHSFVDPGGHGWGLLHLSNPPSVA